MAGELNGYEIVLGVTGGIAAYKAAALCSQLVQQGAGVSVVLTEHAQKFIQPLTFSTLSGRPVYSDLFAATEIYDPGHIRLATRADLIVVAPATANIIAKLAAGICDDLLSTLLCGAESDILLAPAMNQRMWRNPATMRNVQTLQQYGCHLIGPETGHLACAETGPGRMAEPDDILNRIIELLSRTKPKAERKI